MLCLIRMARLLLKHGLIVSRSLHRTHTHKALFFILSRPKFAVGSLPAHSSSSSRKWRQNPCWWSNHSWLPCLRYFTNMPANKNRICMLVLILNSFKNAFAMSESMETPSRTVGYASAKLCNSPLDKKKEPDADTLISIPSVRSLGYFKQLSTLISLAVSTSMSLSFVTFAAKLPGKASELDDTFTHGSVCSNEPPICVLCTFRLYIFVLTFHVVKFLLLSL